MSYPEILINPGRDHAPIEIQKAIDTDLVTEDKTIVGALNTLANKSDAIETDIEELNIDTKEDKSNKVPIISEENRSSVEHYPSNNAVYDYVAFKIAGCEAIVNRVDEIPVADGDYRSIYPSVEAVKNKISDLTLEINEELSYLANYAEQTYATKEELANSSGLFSIVDIPYATAITITPNQVNNISTLSDAVTITLADGIEGKDNEWCFIIAQGETAYDVALPEIEWDRGFAPSFLANTSTEVRLYYRNNVLKGVWE